MKSARSVRPLTAAANVNKNAGHSRRVRLAMSAFPPASIMAK